mmetsp:Transcript_41280/g.108843  ORF Transcript_41280/g.108843 Transcript_41280/m.108843 type:complete len:260 (+) Transcript_41280:110-889(+)
MIATVQRTFGWHMEAHAQICKVHASSVHFHAAGWKTLTMQKLSKHQQKGLTTAGAPPSGNGNIRVRFIRLGVCFTKTLTEHTQDLIMRTPLVLAACVLLGRQPSGVLHLGLGAELEQPSDHARILLPHGLVERVALPAKAHLTHRVHCGELVRLKKPLHLYQARTAPARRAGGRARRAGGRGSARRRATRRCRPAARDGNSCRHARLATTWPKSAQRLHRLGCGDLNDRPLGAALRREHGARAGGTANDAQKGSCLFNP